MKEGCVDIERVLCFSCNISPFTWRCCNGVADRGGSETELLPSPSIPVMQWLKPCKGVWANTVDRCASLSLTFKLLPRTCTDQDWESTTLSIFYIPNSWSILQQTLLTSLPFPGIHPGSRQVLFTSPTHGEGCQNLSLIRLNHSPHPATLADTHSTRLLPTIYSWRCPFTHTHTHTRWGDCSVVTVG